MLSYMFDHWLIIIVISVVTLVVTLVVVWNALIYGFKYGVCVVFLNWWWDPLSYWWSGHRYRRREEQAQKEERERWERERWEQERYLRERRERLEDVSKHGRLSHGIKRAVDVTRARAGKLGHNVEWVFGRRVARALGVLVLFAVVVAPLLVFLNWYVAPTKPSEKKDLVLALAQILAGTALLSGLYFTWRTLQVNREGQITERFTRAIDQLGKTDDKGNKLFEIRLGAVYALERIARESEEDHWPIMEVLTAYVRQHSPRRPEEGQEGAEDAAVEKKSRGGSSGESEPAEFPTPDPDIQAIM